MAGFAVWLDRVVMTVKAQLDDHQGLQQPLVVPNPRCYPVRPRLATTAYVSQAHRDFPPLALTFFHRALAAADILARAAALIFRLRLGRF